MGPREPSVRVCLGCSHAIHQLLLFVETAKPLFVPCKLGHFSSRQGAVGRRKVVLGRIRRVHAPTEVAPVIGRPVAGKDAGRQGGCQPWHVDLAHGERSRSPLTCQSNGGEQGQQGKTGDVVVEYACFASAPGCFHRCGFPSLVNFSWEHQAEKSSHQCGDGGELRPSERNLAGRSCVLGFLPGFPVPRICCLGWSRRWLASGTAGL